MGKVKNEPDLYIEIKVKNRDCEKDEERLILI